MSRDDPSQPNHRDSRRLPLARQVALDFEDFRGFIAEYSKNISMTGMFIESDSPKDPGEVFQFEFRLADGYRLIQGRGQVVWKRDVAEGPDAPAGMGIRFLEIDEAGRQLIGRMLEEYEKSGGRPVDYLPDDIGEPIAARAPEVAAPEAQSPWGDESVAEELSAAAVAEMFEATPLEEPQLPSTPPADAAGPLSPVAGAWMRGSTVKRHGQSRLIAGLLAIGVLAVALLFYLRSDRQTGGSGRPGAASSVAVGESRGSAERAAPTGEAMAASGETDRRTEETPAPIGPPSATQGRRSASGGVAEGGAPEGLVAPEKGAFSGIDQIDWRTERGDLVVELTVDGFVGAADYDVLRLEGTGPPRLLLRLRGVSRAFPKPTLTVDKAAVRRIRTGYHQGAAGAEQHVVFDLTSERVRLIRVEDGGPVLRLQFRPGS